MINKLLYIVLLLVFILPLVFTQSHLNCPEYQRCDKLDARTRNDAEATSSSSSSSNSNSRPLPKWLDFCSCQDNCHQFGDCCENAEQVLISNISSWAILSVNVSPQYRFYTLIKKKCSPHWNHGKRIRTACEKTGFEEEEEFLLPDYGHIISIKEDEFLLWQVTSNKTLTTYRNIYCAICNFEANNLESWRLKLSCVKDDHLETKCGQSLFAFPPKFLIQEKISRKPLIQPHIYTGCSIAWYKSHVKVNKSVAIEAIKNCARFYAPVVYQDESDRKLVIFKNKYCAICSDYRLEDLICPSAANHTYGLKFPNENHQDVNFDTDYIHGGRIGTTEKRCPKDSVYDPFRRHCRSVLLKDEEDTGVDAESDDEEEDEEEVSEDKSNSKASTSISNSSTSVTSESSKSVEDKNEMDNEIPVLPPADGRPVVESAQKDAGKPNSKCSSHSHKSEVMTVLVINFIISVFLLFEAKM